jgi:hypothetical protein
MMLQHRIAAAARGGTVEDMARPGQRGRTAASSSNASVPARPALDLPAARAAPRQHFAL